ncbi:MAG: acyl-CoA thioesterase, partial [Saprospiraceae bacterium]|nr:acyl-CoA thioesterase [Saprospiraceae bacterium]
NEGNLKNNEHIGPILAWQECKYIKPVTYPDTVLVGIRKIETLEDRIITEVKIFSKSQSHLVAISKQATVAYDFHLKQKAPLPLNWIYNES